MTIVEKAAYLKGLADGLGVDPESREGKLWTALNDLLGDIAHEIEDLQSSSLDMAEVIDDISEDLSYLEEITCDLDTPPCPEDFDDGDDPFCHGDCSACESECGEKENVSRFTEEDYRPRPIIFPSMYDDDFSELAASAEGDPELVYDGDEYDLTCPTCGTEFSVTEEELNSDSISCPNCGEDLEVEFDENYDEDFDEDE